MISYSQPIEFKRLPVKPKHRSEPARLLLRVLSTLILCFVSITLTACQSEPTIAAAELPIQLETPLTSDPQIADLTGDSLQAPALPTLSITSDPGFLHLAWTSIPNQQIASIYQFDSVEGLEQLIVQIKDAKTNTTKLPSKTHQRSWHSEQYRIELCDSSACMSSPRVAIAELATTTLQRISPPVFVSGEKYADSVAVNSSASLIAVALPTQGAIDLLSKHDGLWRNMQRIELSPPELSSTREITLGLSSSGNTMSALVTDGLRSYELKIFERFGEAWFETTTLMLPNIAQISTGALGSKNTNTITISEDSNQILMSVNENIFTSYRTLSGWDAPSLLLADHFQPTQIAFSERFSEQSALKAVSINSSHTRLFTVHSLDKNVWLSVWTREYEGLTEPVWNKFSSYAINALNPEKQIQLHSNAKGDRIVLAGWELNNDVAHTPVLWRYELPNLTALDAENNTELIALDSIRFPFSTENSALLHSSADDSLNRLVLGWQSSDSLESTPKASLLTYHFSDSARRWLPKLRLPMAIPTFAEHSFIRSVLLSSKGEAMVISIVGEQHSAAENRAGELTLF